MVDGMLKFIHQGQREKPQMSMGEAWRLAFNNTESSSTGLRTKHRDTVGGCRRWSAVNAFQKHGERELSDTDWLQHIYHGSSKMRFQYCMNTQNSLMFVRAIQGHTGGNLIAPESVGHVAILYKWKEFLFHRGCSFNCTAIFQSGLIAGGRKS